mmetsp:Transcript_39049/g.83341  ORF Transcript_39049/g.83341 Transcript_39049/m.83341 type:complete len:291 (-) Transcript_39049:1411-2283(-)
MLPISPLLPLRQRFHPSIDSLTVGCLVSILIVPYDIHNLQQVLDAYSKVSILVKPWLVADHHAPLHHFLVGPSRTDAVRSLVYVERSANAVTRPVAIVFPNLPQGLSREDVQDEAWSAFREDHGVHSDVSLQHPRVQLPKLIPSVTKVPRPSDVGRSVLVLPSRVDQYWHLVVQMLQEVAALRGPVVHYRTVGTHPCDGGKADLLEPLLLRSETRKYLVHLHLADSPFFDEYRAFEPRHEVGHGDPVDNMGASHSLHLRVILTSLHWRHRVLSIDEVGFGHHAAQRMVGA